jgi:hypothetical protein
MLMSLREWKRWDAVERVGTGRLTMAEAAQVLRLSLRHFRRVRRRVEAQGREGVQHGNRGRSPVNRVPAAMRARLVALRQGKYGGFNDRHFVEKLAEEHPPLRLSVATARRLLRAAGIAAVRRRRPRRHRRRRERKAQIGLMLLWDGSRHDWLERRGPRLTLVGAIDDATGLVLPGAHFVDQESAVAYLRLLRAIVATHGVPWSIYMDQHGALKRNDDCWTLAEELRGQQDPTHVGQALAALEITALYALSPQAKGRVERLWGTLQDRLTSELRLAGAATAAAATAVLTNYIPVHNRRFAVPPRDQQPAWRPLRAGVDLDRICSFRYEATVLRDNTVRLGGLIIDVPPGPHRCSYADRRVQVRQLLDGTWRVYLSNTVIATYGATATCELRALRHRRKGHGSFAHMPEHARHEEVPTDAP